MQTNVVPAKTNLLRRDIELCPGDVQANQSSEILANLSGVKFSSRTVKVDDTIDRLNVFWATANGSAGYLLSPSTSQGNWQSRMTKGEPRQRDLTFEENGKRLVGALLPVLDASIPLMPWDKIPPMSLTDLSLDCQDLVQAFLPSAFQTSEAVQGAFGAFFVTLARDLNRARESDVEAVECEARDKRLIKQVRALPTGTVLIASGWGNGVGVVSDRRGTRTKRNLRILSGSGSFAYDLGQDVRGHFKLLTAERAGDVPSGTLSAHEILQAVAHSEELKPRFPDLA